jgi:uncharacterized protein YbaR (Trm112 family)
MFFFFGWGHRTTTEHGPTIPGTCPNCKNQTWLHLLSYRTWFTLFFIPVIPYESKTLLICPVCSAGVELHLDQVERAKRLNGMARAFLANEIPESVYLSEMREVKLFGSGALDASSEKTPENEAPCSHCGEVAILTSEERLAGRFICPYCNRQVILAAGSES